ncbi:MAG: hypothetical protein QOJ27_1796, partial [Sphingomonadales bacterium]|nr:hypothetical protein [Sphingomonadales bacterium]
MYVRFITPWWRLPRGADCGLFGPAYACARDAEVPAVLREALWAEIGWFEQNLPVPRHPQRHFLVDLEQRRIGVGRHQVV